MKCHKIVIDEPFEFEAGGRLERLELVYHTSEREYRPGETVIWICHALTGNSNPEDWWPQTVGKGKIFDPEKYYIVCAGMLCSPYGSSSPASVNPATGKPYMLDFPKTTVRDVVRANILVRKHLGIEHIDLMIGPSIGGFQALEWVIMEPDMVSDAVFLATSTRVTPYMTAFNESQRMAIEADASWGEPSPEAGLRGMAVARSMGLLSYRGCAAYNATQQEHDNPDKTEGFRACSYQRYQGEKLCRRFNAYSYYRISQAFDSHNIGRGRGGVEQALASLTMPCLVIGISSDLIFPVEEQRYLHEHLPQSRFEVIDSSFGHDGFLVEHRQLNALLGPFIAGV